MSVQTIERGSTTAVFHLVHFIGGEAIPYIPYATTCSSCCGAGAAEETAKSCCR